MLPLFPREAAEFWAPDRIQYENGHTKNITQMRTLLKMLPIDEYIKVGVLSFDSNFETDTSSLVNRSLYWYLETTSDVLKW
jgi:hypothetical protein